MTRTRGSVRCVVLFGWCAVAVSVAAAAQTRPSVVEPGVDCPAALRPSQSLPSSIASGVPSLDLGWTMTGTAAFSKVYDDEGSLGSGTSFAGSVGYAWSRSFTLEFTLLHARHVRDVTGFRWESRPTTATVRVIREFGSSRVRPLVAGGLGIMWVSGRTEVREWRGPFDPPPVTVASHIWDSTGLAVDLALGVNVHATDRLFVRPEWRLVASRPVRAPFAPEPPYSMMMWTVGVGYRF